VSLAALWRTDCKRNKWNQESSYDALSSTPGGPHWRFTLRGDSATGRNWLASLPLATTELILTD
jgi:hypothetical protein